ncbi:unnamed protein product [Onchocerca flexuosa]|uniref:ShKT domain-containing protein n=1 Tax=Onchocerca flexuosa TaxID=387005 RepID=A0A183H974_9BILA|nr:unnamed protein product [Onchocerca flexuosa]
MDVTLVFSLATVSILIDNTDADVPSCGRARCHHCQVNFIAEMCPETCRSCSKRITAPSQPRTQLSSVRQFPTTSSPPASNQQTLVNTIFPTFPPLLTFTFPTLPPFTFPTTTRKSELSLNQTKTILNLSDFFLQVTFAPPIYHSALPQIPSNQFSFQIPTLQKFDLIQTQLFQLPRQIGALGSEQTVAALYATISSQPQIYLQPLPPQTHPTSFAIQKHVVPVYPANKQQLLAHLSAQQLQSQREVPYLQVQKQHQRPKPQLQPQPRCHFNTTNQQPPLDIKPFQPQLPPKVFPDFHY